MGKTDCSDHPDLADNEREETDSPRKGRTLLLRIAILLLPTLAALGCIGPDVSWRSDVQFGPQLNPEYPDAPPPNEAPAGELPLPPPRRDEEVVAREGPPTLQLDEVVDAVYRAYPMLEAAFFRRDIAAGEHLAAHGEFDLRLRGASENAAMGFYRNYRQSMWVEQPTFGGGNVFSGYRLGRGNIPPWYGERVTNDGGEFRAGLALPLLRNVDIDARRAQLWRTQLGRQIADQEIRSLRIDFVLDASEAYWNWVAAGRRYYIAESLLQIARDRNEAIRRRVEEGDVDPPVLADNQRLIVSREAALIENRQRLERAAISLSLYYRNGLGEPIIPGFQQLPDFPTPAPFDAERLEPDIQAALANRPDLQLLELSREQRGIDLEEARNDLLPDLQATLAASQDVGGAASLKRDKSEVELGAALLLDVPLQRRNARGRVTATEGRLGQIAAHRRMTADRISTEMRAVYATVLAAHQQVERARESVELALQLAAIERRAFELGESDLLMVNLREQQAAEAESLLVSALFESFAALARYRAVLASD